MIRVLESVNACVWGIPLLALIAGVGGYFSISTGFIQLRLLPKALHSFLSPAFQNSNDERDREKKRALYTALAATVGTGNMAGVGGAIALGGPGAIFWMWIFGVLGMVTKLAEATLAVRFHCIGGDGRPVGGPMYMIMRGLHKKWHFLAYAYSFFGIVASFGVGNGTQINAVVGGFHSVLSIFGVKPIVLIDAVVGLALAAVVLRILKRGVDGIGSAAEKLVPIAAIFYILLCVIGLLIRGNIISAFRLIFQGAFAPNAVTGGVVGSVFMSLRIGAARGVFTNEAGMGTASMAHATASARHPVEQGLLGVVEVFIDTILICTLTALVILTSGVNIPYGTDPGILLTTQAFVNIYGYWVSVFISVALCLFAFATVLGWALYGLQCVRFVFGDKAIRSYIYMHGVVVMIAAIMHTDTLWLMAEIVNGLMAIPNLIVLLKLSPELFYLVSDYKKRHLP